MTLLNPTWRDRVRNRRKLTYDGIIYASSLEVSIAQDLTERGVEYEYEPFRIAYTISITHGYCPDCGGKPAVVDRKYTPDFYLPKTNIIVEAKGRFTAGDRKKHAAIKKEQPLLDLRMLFSHDNYLTKKGRLRYSDWCKSKGIVYAIGMTVPTEWV